MSVATNKIDPRSHGWLDSLAIGMSMLCAVHCLLTPLLIVALPIIATTFWVSTNFHLWMLLLVVPTTSLAVFMGCRRHKDDAVFLLGVFGLACLVSITIYEMWGHSQIAAGGYCPHCAAVAEGDLFNAITGFNVLGGVLLASAHTRNFMLCRRARCAHGQGAAKLGCSCGSD
ncbi:MAG: MerC domain-containing protein [Opitutales bacterium]|nr:MerC domain-containing protein [Opitutales bacterium]NRA27259.1 MerC domain-containing protein [Opitutales bacterium]